MARFVVPILLIVAAILLGLALATNTWVIWLLVPVVILIGVGVWDSVHVRRQII